MKILALKTDTKEAQILLTEGTDVLSEEKWQAHKELSVTLHAKIEDLLRVNNIDYKDLQGLIVFRGPGSFTGLRIGITVANTLADGLNIPIVGTQTDDWINQGMGKLKDGKNDRLVLPEYGGEPNITKQKK